MNEDPALHAIRAMTDNSNVTVGPAITLLAGGQLLSGVLVPEDRYINALQGTTAEALREVAMQTTSTPTQNTALAEAHKLERDGLVQQHMARYRRRRELQWKDSELLPEGHRDRKELEQLLQDPDHVTLAGVEVRGRSVEYLRVRTASIDAWWLDAHAHATP